MNELQLIFNYGYENFPVRIVTSNVDVIWFVLKDVCDLLEIANSRDTYNRLDEDEKGVGLTDTLGGRQEMQLVNESGLYTVILRSRSNRAKPFRRWVTHDVLPTIRKQGYYSLMSDDELIDIITEKQRRNAEFLAKIDKRAICSKLLREQRDEREEDTRLLFLYQDKYPLERFKTELRKIWEGDSAMYHKYWKEYWDWYKKVGYKIIPEV